jgi:hypothetical protein
MNTRLEAAKEKAKSMLKPDKFEAIDKHINSIPVPGTKKADLWENILKGEMILNTWIEPTNCSEEELSKIDIDIKERGTDAILDILDKQMMLPENLKKHLRKNYLKELLEAKEIVHKRKYSSIQELRNISTNQK